MDKQPDKRQRNGQQHPASQPAIEKNPHIEAPSSGPLSGSVAVSVSAHPADRWLGRLAPRAGSWLPGMFRCSRHRYPRWDVVITSMMRLVANSLFVAERPASPVRYAPKQVGGRQWSSGLTASACSLDRRPLSRSRRFRWSATLRRFQVGAHEPVELLKLMTLPDEHVLCDRSRSSVISIAARLVSMIPVYTTSSAARCCWVSARPME